MPQIPRKSFNPWPVAIIAFFALAICGAIGFVIFCTRQPVELVTTDYYEEELRFQDHLDQSHRAASLKAPAQIAFDQASRRLTITLPAEQLTESLKGWIRLYRPSSTALDQELPLQVDARGVQVIDAASFSQGLWHVRVSWTVNGADYFHDQKLVIGGKQT